MSFATINDDILRTLRPPGRVYYAGLALALAALSIGVLAFLYQARTGMGVAGYEHPVLWAVYITNFVFWVGIAHSGTLISAILFLFRAKWRTAVARAAAARKLAGMLQALNTCPKPVIGAVQGNAFGGGIGMMSVCDVAIGVEGAKFGLTETRLGLTPATISPYVVARMGEARARRVFMSSRIFEAAEARDLGLLAKVVLPEVLERAVMAEAEPYLACAPGAVGEAKALVRALGPRIDESVIDMTIEALARLNTISSQAGRSGR